MSNKSMIFVYLFFFFVTVFIAYNSYSNSAAKMQSKLIKELNTSMIQEYQTKFAELPDFNYLWGVKLSKKKEKKEKKEVAQIKKVKKKICIGKKCYRFLGLYFKEHQAYVTFYSKEFKKGLKDFRIGEVLVKPLVIKELHKNNLYIENNNTKKVWKFDFFDVNTSKYRPKDINESAL